MASAMGKSASVEAYMAALAPPQRKALEKLRAQIHAAAPDTSEKMAYGIPTFVHKGRNLVHMAAFKGHCSFFPGSGGVTLALESELDGYTLWKGTIQFAPEKPIPAALVKRIVKLRLAEEEARGAKKSAKRPATKRAAKASAKKRR